MKLNIYILICAMTAYERMQEKLPELNRVSYFFWKSSSQGQKAIKLYQAFYICIVERHRKPVASDLTVKFKWKTTLIYIFERIKLELIVLSVDGNLH